MTKFTQHNRDKVSRTLTPLAYMIVLWIGAQTLVLQDGSDKTMTVAILSGVFLLLLVCLAFSPSHILVTEKGIIQKQRIGCFKIPWERIATAERYVPSGRTFRIWGSGGLHGYYGWFYNPAIGRFRMYATNRENLVSVTLKSGRRVILSADDADGLVLRIRQRLGDVV